MSDHYAPRGGGLKLLPSDGVFDELPDSELLLMGEPPCDLLMEALAWYGPPIGMRAGMARRFFHPPVHTHDVPYDGGGGVEWP